MQLCSATNCRLSGIRAVHYAYDSFSIIGDDAVVEDCLAVDCGCGVHCGGWNRRGGIIRRNTVIGALGCGIISPGPAHRLPGGRQPGHQLRRATPGTCPYGSAASR